jgi:hypothetical protein
MENIADSLAFKLILSAFAVVFIAWAAGKWFGYFRDVKRDAQLLPRRIDTVAEFRRRNRRFWSTLPGGIAVGLLGFLVLFVTSRQGDVSVPVLAVFFALFLLGGMIMAWAIYRFRCPSCNVMLTRTTLLRPGADGVGGMDLNPEGCPNCGARFR